MKKKDRIVLEGISRHGKNRIHQHGNVWLLDEVRGDRMRLLSEHKTFKVGDHTMHDGRWVLLKNDPNFTWSY